MFSSSSIEASSSQAALVPGPLKNPTPPLSDQLFTLCTVSIYSREAVLLLLIAEGAASVALCSAYGHQTSNCLIEYVFVIIVSITQLSIVNF